MDYGNIAAHITAPAKPAPTPCTRHPDAPLVGAIDAGTNAIRGALARVDAPGR
jgi:hypothetical protein